MSICHICLKSEEATQLRRKGTWEKGPTTEPELMTYALPQSFSHVSYRIGHAPSSHIPHGPVTGLKWSWLRHTRDWHISGDVGRRSVADSVARMAETLR